MEVRSYNLNSYNLHVIKSDKVKSCHMEIHFREKVKKENIFYKSFLCDILTDCSKDLDTRRDVVIKLEELYKSSFFGSTSKTGGVINTIFVYNFISPKYIKEDTYLEDVLALPFDMLLNPKVLNKAFEENTFEVIKERMIRDLESMLENPNKLGISNALNVMDKDSLTSVSVMGDIASVEAISPSSLYKEYLNMINNNTCDIYVVGDIDFDQIHKIISKSFKLKTIKTNKLDMYVENKIVKKVKKEIDESTFVQSNLNIIYNLDNLNSKDRNIDFQVFNYLFGSGGLSSKLYKKLREENSLCYGVYSIYLKYDNIMIVQVSLDESNREKAIKLIDESLKEMVKGKFLDEELDDAKNNLMTSLKMSLDNNIALLSNFIFHLKDNLPPIEERIEMIKNITKEDVIKVAKKVKINTIYALKGKVNK